MNFGKTAFIFSGGGFTGAYSVGFLKALTAKGIRPDFVQGVSVGSINAAKFLESGVEELEKRWLKIQELGPSSIFDSPIFHSANFEFKLRNWRHWKNLILKLRSPAICDNDRLFKLLIRDLDFQAIVDSDIEFQVITFNKSKNTQEVFSNRDDRVRKNPPLLGQAILASCSLPFFLPPVLINGEWHSDGQTFKLKEAINAKCDTIFLFLNNQFGPLKLDFGNLKSYHLLLLELQTMNNSLAKKGIKRAVENGYELIQNNPSPEFDDVVNIKPAKKLKRTAKKIVDDVAEAVTDDNVELKNIFARHRIIAFTPPSIISSYFTLGFKQPDPKNNYPGDMTAGIEECFSLDKRFCKQLGI